MSKRNTFLVFFKISFLFAIEVIFIFFTKAHFGRKFPHILKYLSIFSTVKKIKNLDEPKKNYSGILKNTI